MGFQVPMIEVAVTVALSGVEPEEHFLYLAPFSDRREGPETVSDYLNGRRRFFPMLVAGMSKMLNRDQILWVRYERLPDIADVDDTIIEKRTLIELADATSIEGVLSIGDRPRESSRVSDVLNDPREEFFRLDDENETYYINKIFVRSVTPR